MQDSALAPDVSGCLSPQCESFVRWCLTVDPRRRPSVDDLATHPWIACTVAARPGAVPAAAPAAAAFMQPAVAAHVAPSPCLKAAAAGGASRGGTECSDAADLAVASGVNSASEASGTSGSENASTLGRSPAAAAVRNAPPGSPHQPGRMQSLRLAGGDSHMDSALGSPPGSAGYQAAGHPWQHAVAAAQQQWAAHVAAQQPAAPGVPQVLRRSPHKYAHSTAAAAAALRGAYGPRMDVQALGSLSGEQSADLASQTYARVADDVAVQRSPASVAQHWQAAFSPSRSPRRQLFAEHRALGHASPQKSLPRSSAYALPEPAAFKPWAAAPQHSSGPRPRFYQLSPQKANAMALDAAQVRTPRYGASGDALTASPGGCGSLTSRSCAAEAEAASVEHSPGQLRMAMHAHGCGLSSPHRRVLA